MSELEYMGSVALMMAGMIMIAWWANKLWPVISPSHPPEPINTDDLEDDDVIEAWNEIADIKAAMRHREGPPSAKDGIDHK